MTGPDLFEFPCAVPVKIFGRNDQVFRAAALNLVQRHFANVTDQDIDERLSKKDRFLSLTVTVMANSREELDALYVDLSTSDDILMAL
jgi:putative lipoic acid-binding regulatory protein